MELSEGMHRRFRQAKNARWRWTWQERDDKPLVQFTIRSGFEMTEGLVEMERDAAALPEVPLLVVLAEYLLGLFAVNRQVGAPNVWPSPLDDI